MARAYWTTKPDMIAQCQDCPWTNYNRGAQGLSAQHHDRTGHVVCVEVSRAIYYGEDRPRQRRWWKRP